MKPPAVLLATTILFAGCLSGTQEVQPTSEDAIPASQGPTILATGGGRAFTFKAEGAKLTDPTWDLGDGTTAKGMQTTHTYAVSNGLFSVVLAGKDVAGKTVRVGKQLTVGTGQNSPPVAAFQPPAATVAAGAPFTVDASATKDPDGDGLKISWTLAPPAGVAAPPSGGHGNHGGRLREGDESVAPLTAPVVTRDAGHGGGDEAPPAATRKPIETGLFGSGVSKDVKFDLPGIYTIHCHPHPWMIAKVVVEETAPSRASAEIVEYSYQPYAIRIAPGGAVAFKNAEPTPVSHTVTEAAFVPAGEKLAASNATGPLTIASAGTYDLVLSVEDGKGQVGVAVQQITVSEAGAAPGFAADYAGAYDGVQASGVAADYVRRHAFELPQRAVGTVAGNVTSAQPSFGDVAFRLLDADGTIVARDLPMKVDLAAGAYTLEVQPTQAVAVNLAYDLQVRLRYVAAGQTGGGDAGGGHH